MTADPSKCCVIVPYKDNIAIAEACLRSLAGILPEGARIVAVDDGSTDSQEGILSLTGDARIHRIVHKQARGPASARNAAFKWCRREGIEIVILLDSDCLAPDDFISTHLRLMDENPDAVCIGGAIQGTGKGPWAWLDRVASWFTSIPGSSAREVGSVYHIPTTNMSIRFSALSGDEACFDEKLKTGEDVKFVRLLREKGKRILFSPIPVIQHRDREDFRGMMRHQYRWGLHTYAMRHGLEGSALNRLCIAAMFVPLIPVYGIAGSVVNILPWLTVSWFYVLSFPLLFLLYVFKGFGVVEGILWPQRALWPMNNGSENDDET